MDAFVHCLLPAARLAMFSKVGTLEAVISLHNLALVRPDFVLPDLLSRLAAALCLGESTTCVAPGEEYVFSERPLNIVREP